MEIKETKARIWRREFKTKDGKEFFKYTVSIGKKDDSGKWINAYLPVVFSKKSGAPQKVPNGATCSIEGFMAVDSYTDREGNEHNEPVIIVMKALFDNDPEDMGDSFEQADGDIPF